MDPRSGLWTRTGALIISAINSAWQVSCESSCLTSGRRAVRFCLFKTTTQPDRVSLIFWDHIGLERTWHLVEGRGNMDRHKYGSILLHTCWHQLVTCLVVRIQIPFPTDQSISLHNQGHCCPGWPEIHTFVVFTIYWYHWAGNWLHHGQMKEWPMFDCCITSSAWPPALGEITPESQWNLYRHLPWRVAALRRAQGHPNKFWWNVHLYLPYLAFNQWTLLLIYFCLVSVSFVITRYHVIVCVIGLYVIDYSMMPSILWAVIYLHDISTTA